ncbi:MAG TPA: DUF6588 family protein [Candidatus Eisenbacteria bacterium]|nr:DUF6588 family protein [Candidatus Eisenbacteria bacterium]
MNRRIAVFLALALAAAAAVAPPAGAQLQDNLGALSGDNAKKYLGPLPDALSGTMNSAIFTSGKVPMMGVTFQLGVKLMGIKFDDADRLFTPTDPPGFTSVAPYEQAPTVIGAGSAVTQNGQGGTAVYYPGGFDVGEFAFAAPQLTIGSVLGTKAVIRWASGNFSSDNFIEKISFFGIGAQHSISRYLPPLPIDLAAGVFYQSFKINENLLESKAIHVDVTGSKDFALLQPYAAIGFDSFKLDALYEDSTNPGNNISVDFDRKTNVHLTAGLLANLPVVKIHAEANIAATNGLAVGLSFGK